MLAAPPVLQQLKQAPIMAFQPTGEAVPLSEVVTAPPAEAEATAAPMAPVAVLPATASSLPLIGLLGLLILAGAFVTRLAAGRLQTAANRLQ